MKRNKVNPFAFVVRAGQLAWQAYQERRLGLSPHRWLIDLRHLRGAMASEPPWARRPKMATAAEIEERRSAILQEAQAYRFVHSARDRGLVHVQRIDEVAVVQRLGVERLAHPDDLDQLADVRLYGGLHALGNEIVDEIARLYAQRFSEAELKEVIAFYKSPVGKKFAGDEPVVIDQGLQRAEAWSKKMSDEVMTRFRTPPRASRRSAMRWRARTSTTRPGVAGRPSARRSARRSPAG